MYELRLCVTKDCNFKCTYCRKGGEGSYKQNPIMTIKGHIKLSKAIKVTYTQKYRREANIHNNI